MLVFNRKFVSGSRKIKFTIEGLAFDTPCWAIMPVLLRTLLMSLLQIKAHLVDKLSCLWTCQCILPLVIVVDLNTLPFWVSNQSIPCNTAFINSRFNHVFQCSEVGQLLSRASLSFLLMNQLVHVSTFKNVILFIRLPNYNEREDSSI